MSVPFTKMHGLGNDFIVFDYDPDSDSCDASPQLKYVIEAGRLLTITL